MRIATAKCSDCGTVLNTSKPVEKKDEVFLIMSGPLNMPACPKGCRATYSDCNANYDLVWSDVADSEKTTGGKTS